MQATNSGGMAVVVMKEGSSKAWEFRMPGQVLRMVATPHFIAVGLKSGIVQVRIAQQPP